MMGQGVQPVLGEIHKPREADDGAVNTTEGGKPEYFGGIIPGKRLVFRKERQKVGTPTTWQSNKVAATGQKGKRSYTQPTRLELS